MLFISTATLKSIKFLSSVTTIRDEEYITEQYMTEQYTSVHGRTGYNSIWQLRTQYRG